MEGVTKDVNYSQDLNTAQYCIVIIREAEAPIRCPFTNRSLQIEQLNNKFKPFAFAWQQNVGHEVHRQFHPSFCFVLCSNVLYQQQHSTCMKRSHFIYWSEYLKMIPFFMPISCACQLG